MKKNHTPKFVKIICSDETFFTAKWISHMRIFFAFCLYLTVIIAHRCYLIIPQLYMYVYFLLVYPFSSVSIYNRYVRILLLWFNARLSFPDDIARPTSTILFDTYHYCTFYVSLNASIIFTNYIMDIWQIAYKSSALYCPSVINQLIPWTLTVVLFVFKAITWLCAIPILIAPIYVLVWKEKNFSVKNILIFSIWLCLADSMVLVLSSLFGRGVCIATTVMISRYLVLYIIFLTKCINVYIYILLCPINYFHV